MAQRKTAATRKTQTDRPRRQPPATTPPAEPDVRPSGFDSGPRSTGSESTTEPPAAAPPVVDDPFAIDGDRHEPERDDVEAIPPGWADVDEAPTLIEWTPERAAAIVKGAGLLLHVADPAGAIDPRAPRGTDGVPVDPVDALAAQLWKQTEADALEAGRPLSRILNRYPAAQRLAGVADEGEFAFAMLAYAKRNLGDRGRILSARAAGYTAVPPEHGGLFEEGDRRRTVGDDLGGAGDRSWLTDDGAEGGGDGGGG